MGIKFSGSDAGGFRFNFSGANSAAGGSAVRAGEIKAEAAGVGAGKFDAHKFFLSFCTKPCNKMRLFHDIISLRDAKTSGTEIC